MDQTFELLKSAAAAVLGEFQLCDEGKNAASVASALRTRGGNIFTGVCVHLGCGIGTCAEHAAITEMLKARETEIDAIIAITENNKILPPCGRCRELMLQVNASNMKSRVYVKEDLVVTVRELLPFHWLEEGA